MKPTSISFNESLQRISNQNIKELMLHVENVQKHAEDPSASKEVLLEVSCLRDALLSELGKFDSDQKNGDQAMVIYDLLIKLAETFPVSSKSISEENQFILANGHIFDLDELFKWNVDVAKNHSGLDDVAAYFHKNEFINPETKTRLLRRDATRLWKAAIHKEELRALIPKNEQLLIALGTENLALIESILKDKDINLGVGNYNNINPIVVAKGLNTAFSHKALELFEAHAKENINVKPNEYYGYFAKSDEEKYAAYQDACSKGDLELMQRLEAVDGFDVDYANKANNYDNYRKACLLGRFDIVSHLIETKGFNLLSAQRASHYGVFIQACQQGNIEVIKHVLDTHTSKDKIFPSLILYHGYQAACLHGQIGVLSFFEHTKDFDVSKALSSDDSAVWVNACYNGDIHLVEHLLKLNGDKSHLFEHSLFSRAYQSAVSNNQLDMIKYLDAFSATHSLPEINIDGRIYDLACTNADLNLLKYLESKPQFDVKKISINDFQKAYLGAVSHNRLDIMTHLEQYTNIRDSLEKNSKIYLSKNSNAHSSTINFLDTAYEIACREGHLDMMKHLEKMPGFQISKLVSYEQTLLYNIACAAGHLDVIQHLELKANLNVAGLLEKGNYRAFHAACYSGKMEVIRHLEEKAKTFDILKAINDDYTGLYREVALRGHLPVMQYLEEKVGITKLIKVYDSQEVNRLYIEACTSGQLGVVEHIEKVMHPYLRDAATANKYAAYIAACQNGYLPIVRHLESKKGFDVKAAVAAQLYKPYFEARRKGHLHVLEHIEQTPGFNMEKVESVLSHAGFYAELERNPVGIAEHIKDYVINHTKLKEFAQLATVPEARVLGVFTNRASFRKVPYYDEERQKREITENVGLLIEFIEQNKRLLDPGVLKIGDSKFELTSRAYREAAKVNKLEVLQYLEAIPGFNKAKVFSHDNFALFKEVSSSGQKMLLKDFFDHANATNDLDFLNVASNSSDNKLIQDEFYRLINNLIDQKNECVAINTTVPFDLHSVEEANKYFVILQWLIRDPQNWTKDKADITMKYISELLKVPAIQNRCNQPVVNKVGKNQLLKLSIDNKRPEVALLLLEQESVRKSAYQSADYMSDLRSTIDLLPSKARLLIFSAFSNKEDARRLLKEENNSGFNTLKQTLMKVNETYELYEQDTQGNFVAVGSEDISEMDAVANEDIRIIMASKTSKEMHEKLDINHAEYRLSLIGKVSKPPLSGNPDIYNHIDLYANKNRISNAADIREAIDKLVAERVKFKIINALLSFESCVQIKSVFLTSPNVPKIKTEFAELELTENEIIELQEKINKMFRLFPGKDNPNSEFMNRIRELSRNNKGTLLFALSNRLGTEKLLDQIMKKSLEALIVKVKNKAISASELANTLKIGEKDVAATHGAILSLDKESFISLLSGLESSDVMKLFRSQNYKGTFFINQAFDTKNIRPIIVDWIKSPDGLKKLLNLSSSQIMKNNFGGVNNTNEELKCKLFRAFTENEVKLSSEEITALTAKKDTKYVIEFVAAAKRVDYETMLKDMTQNIPRQSFKP